MVFEQQPSGLLGAAAPDGSHQVAFTKVGPLQGNDLPVASSDGRYLVNQEGQLVTMGPAGPVSISSLPQPAGVQSSGFQWQDASFADGSRYVEATECYSSAAGPAGATQSWRADLMPTAGGPDRLLGTVLDSAGDPRSAGAFESISASLAAASSTVQCYGPSVPDKSVELLQPGQPTRTIVTAGDLSRALGVSPGTPLEFTANPNPDGSLLAVYVTVGAPQTAAAYLVAQHDLVVVTRSGTIVTDLRLPVGSFPRWSPDGHHIAFCQEFRQVASSATVTVWGVSSAAKTIALPGHRDFGCTQLLWSPDGSQLIYAAEVTKGGLTAADDLQHGWTVIEVGSGQVHDVTAPGQPAAWLAAKAGGTG